VHRRVGLAQVQLVRGPDVVLERPEAGLSKGLRVATDGDDVFVQGEVKIPGRTSATGACDRNPSRTGSW
jgi:hypothetical protein